MAHGPIRSVQVVVTTADLAADLEFFGPLGFRVDAIHPADAPAHAVISGHGIVLRLDPAEPGQPNGPVALRVVTDDPQGLAGPGASSTPAGPMLVAPNGTRLLFVSSDPPVVVPPLSSSFVLSRAGAPDQWHVGRAGMRYRDLVPGRQGGRFIASHIAIPEGGPVPDYVHFHKIRFQMIFCRRGWVRLVYEDQGEQFVMQAGDCVLQPPRIRHRVLEASPGLEVVEIGCPAEHETIADHGLPLPTGRLDPARDFGGQRFVRHQAATAEWQPWRAEGFEARDIGFGAATDGLAGARVVRPAGAAGAAAATPRRPHHSEFLFLFVLDGALTLRRDDAPDERLEVDDAVVIPAGLAYQLADCCPGLEFLEVSLPHELI